MFFKKLAHHAAGHSHEVLVALVLEGEKLHLVVLIIIAAALITAFALQIIITERGL